VANAIKEIHRILKPSGQIIASVNYHEAATDCAPNVLNDEVLRNLLNGKFDYKIVKRFPKDYDAGIGGLGRFRCAHEIVLVKGGNGRTELHYAVSRGTGMWYCARGANRR